MGRSAAWQAVLAGCKLMHTLIRAGKRILHASTTLRFYASTLLHPYASTLTTIVEARFSTFLRFYASTNQSGVYNPACVHPCSCLCACVRPCVCVGMYACAWLCSCEFAYVRQRLPTPHASSFSVRRRRHAPELYMACGDVGRVFLGYGVIRRGGAGRGSTSGGARRRSAHLLSASSGLRRAVRTRLGALPLTRAAILVFGTEAIESIFGHLQQLVASVFVGD